MRQQYSILQQCDAHLKPLLEALHNHVWSSFFFQQFIFFQTLALDVLEFVYKICLAIEAGDSSKANDLYLRLAIGNDPWPLGVTAVC